MKSGYGRVALLFLTMSPAFAQLTALLRGTVTDSQSGAIADAQVEVRNPLTGFSATTQSDADGHFQIANIPWQTYTITFRKDGFEPQTRQMALRSNVPVQFDATLAIRSVSTEIEVNVSEHAQIVDAESTGTRTELNRSTMEHMPVAPSNRGLESMLLSFPGFAANANGAIHPRGAHNQMTYVVDGMAITDQLTGAFANAVDPSFVQSVELFTGNIPSEFGSKVSGVAVITTRTGLGSGRRFAGSTQATAGGFDTVGNITQVTGGTDKWGYFGSFNALKSHRYLDQVSIDNLHNGGNSERAFSRIDYQPNGLNQFRINLMSGRSSFQLANLRSQQAEGQDQRQEMRDGSVSFGWLRTLDARSTVDTTFSVRTANAKLLPAPAFQDRQLTTITAGTRWNRVAGRHNWRAGFDLQKFPVREEFSYQERSFRGRGTGGLYSGFIQDSIRLGDLQLTLGLRYDNYRFMATGDQWQPRIGAAWHLKATNTVFRASYNRLYQTPPNENLLLSSSAGSLPIRPERQNVYEVGLQQGFGRRVSLNAAFYHKNSKDLQDNDNFLNTGIIFPITLARSRTNGAEARLTVLPVAGFSGSFSITHLHTIVTPPFTGGLFVGSDPVQTFGTKPFVIDHDQPLGMHGLMQYNLTRRLWSSVAVRYDSGLVANPSDPEEVAADPDYRDLLPYVDLLSYPARVRPRTLTDLAIGYDGYKGDRRKWDVALQVANIANVTALYNFQSVFVGTRLVQPRTVSVKLRFWF